MKMLKEYYRKIKKYIAIKRGVSKPDSMTYAQVSRISQKPIVWLLGTEDFGNLGDHKIALAIRHFLERYFSDYDVVEISARNYFECCYKMEKLILPDDIIVGTGGGNFGNQYPYSQKIRIDFIKRFPNNKIIIMPQTIWYTKNDEGKKALERDARLCGEHKRLLLAVREKKSKRFAEDNFSNPVVLVPDMVLFEKKYAGKEVEKDKVLLCLRSDLEGVLDKRNRDTIVRCLQKEFKKIEKVDTQKDYLISTEKREEEVNQILGKMSSAELVVTDRLHGMVFAALAQTPCIVFDNYNGKVQGIYEWIEDLPFIRYKGTDIEIENDISELRKIKGNYAPKMISGEFDSFAETIRKF